MNQVRPDRFKDGVRGGREDRFADGAGAPPVEPPPTGGGRPGPDHPPRRGVRQWVPWLALGAVLLAVERLALITLAMGGLGVEAYAIAAAVFLLMVGAGVLIGGRAFHRAWHDAHREPPGAT